LTENPYKSLGVDPDSGSALWIAGARRDRSGKAGKKARKKNVGAAGLPFHKQAEL
jgi:hypothetical protein